MKLKHLIQPLTEDFTTICVATGTLLTDAAEPAGKTGLQTMYALLDMVSKNRAYDDSHPGFASGTWKRLLPHDGRDYCFYYADGANDTHVATLLKAVQANLLNGGRV